MIEHVFLLLLGLEKNYSTPTVSMQPTIMLGDNYFAKNYRIYNAFGPMLFAPPPHVGDIVIFHAKAPGELWCKRIVALAGDRVQMIKGRLYVNDTVVERHEIGVFDDVDDSGAVTRVTRFEETLPNGVAHLINEISDDEHSDNTGEYVVPEGSVFVLGDNRDRSADSRHPSILGYVQLSDLVSVLPHEKPIVFSVRAGQ